MGNRTVSFIAAFIALLPAGIVAWRANAASVALPVADGAWVNVAKPCGSATEIHIFNRNRSGLVQVNDPAYPLDGRMNIMENIADKGGGFIEYDQGQQIKAAPGGQAIIRSMYPTSIDNPALREGSRETLRACPVSSLPVRVRPMVALMLTGADLPASPPAAPPAAPAKLPAKLPISDGVWVETKYACNSETDAYLFNGKWYVEIDFWDPVLRPTAYLGDILRIKPKSGGFTGFNDNLQVKTVPGGQAVMRMIDAGDTVDKWTKTVRLCPAASLSPRIRPLVEPLLAGADIPADIATVEPATSAVATTPMLPVADGAWVDVKEACNKATGVKVFMGDRYGDFYFYGPNLSMGPDGGLDPVESIESKGDGFTGFNGGLQVKPLANGQIIFRIVGYEGPMSNPGPLTEMSRDTLRQCTPASLPPRMRAKVEPLLTVGRDRANAPTPVKPVAAVPQWTTRPAGNGRIFANSPSAESSGLNISLTCDGSRPIAAIEIPGRTARYATLKVNTADGNATQKFERDASSGLYVGYVADSNFIRLLAGGTGVADLDIDSAPRTSRLPLEGSTQSITTALAQCWRSS